MPSDPHCEHCDAGVALEHVLKETANFRIVCDAHPLMEGHLLIIPKDHIACMGELPPPLFQEFIALHGQCAEFLRAHYGNMSAFEHGKIGQTVLHAHTHLLPITIDASVIVPEGTDCLSPIASIEELPLIFKHDGQYLFLQIEDQLWTVDTALGEPRFFRDRFASALGVPERGDWKAMDKNAALMEAASVEIRRCKEHWNTR